MADLIHRVYSEDGSFIDRPFTDEEIKVYEENKKAFEFEKLQIKKATETAQSKLEALGLTLEDLRALGI